MSPEHVVPHKPDWLVKVLSVSRSRSTSSLSTSSSQIPSFAECRFDHGVVFLPIGLSSPSGTFIFVAEYKHVPRRPSAANLPGPSVVTEDPETNRPIGGKDWLDDVREPQFRDFEA